MRIEILERDRGRVGTVDRLPGRRVASAETDSLKVGIEVEHQCDSLSPPIHAPREPPESCARGKPAWDLFGCPQIDATNHGDQGAPASMLRRGSRRRPGASRPRGSRARRRRGHRQGSHRRDRVQRGPEGAKAQAPSVPIGGPRKRERGQREAVTISTSPAALCVAAIGQTRRQRPPTASASAARAGSPADRREPTCCTMQGHSRGCGFGSIERLLLGDPE